MRRRTYLLQIRLVMSQRAKQAKYQLTNDLFMCRLRKIKRFRRLDVTPRRIRIGTKMPHITICRAGTPNSSQNSSPVWLPVVLDMFNLTISFISQFSRDWPDLLPYEQIVSEDSTETWNNQRRSIFHSSISRSDVDKQTFIPSHPDFYLGSSEWSGNRKLGRVVSNSSSGNDSTTFRAGLSIWIWAKAAVSSHSARQISPEHLKF